MEKQLCGKTNFGRIEQKSLKTSDENVRNRQPFCLRFLNQPRILLQKLFSRMKNILEMNEIC